MHIMAADSTHAEMILALAQQSGFRESGIMSLGECPMIAVRSTGLALDCIVAYEGTDGQILSLVDETYLHTLVTIANERFDTNRHRIMRLTTGLLERFGARASRNKPHKDSDCEDRAARRERKRREGLAIQQQHHQNALDNIDGPEQSDQMDFSDVFQD
jgi:tRNA wybutosine-synthesizing protein 3